MRSQLRSVSGTSFLLTLARLAGAGTGILLQILIARTYGASVLGDYFMALSLAAIVSMLISFGYPWIVAPIVARSESDHQPEALQKFLSLVCRDLLFASLMFGIPGIMLICFLPDIGAMQRISLLLGLATAPVFAVMRINGSLANAFKYFRIANLPELLLRPLLTFSIILLAVLLTYELTAPKIVAINFVVTCCLAIWMTRSLPGQARLNFTSSPASLNVTTQDKSQWRKLAFPMIFSALFVNMFADLDLFMISLILPAEQTGVFGVCIKIAALLVFTVQVVHQIMLRDAADAHLQNDQDQMQKIIGRANRFAILASIASLILILLFGSFVLKMFGPEFVVGYSCLAGLVGAQLIRAIAGPAIQVLMIAGKQHTGIPVYGVSIAVLFVANLLLVPSFGYVGAAASVIITTLFWGVWLNMVVRRETGYSVTAFGSI